MNALTLHQGLAKRVLGLAFILVMTLPLQACVVLAVADLAATAVVKTAGLVVDGAVGTVKVVGGVVGAVLPGGSDKDKDNKSDSKDKKK